MLLLCQIPKLPVICNAEDPLKALPKPPVNPLEVKRGVARAGARLRRTGSLPMLPPLVGHTVGKEKTDEC